MKGSELFGPEKYSKSSRFVLLNVIDKYLEYLLRTSSQETLLLKVLIFRFYASTIRYVVDFHYDIDFFLHRKFNCILNVVKIYSTN